jgi:hypothetical protein
VIVSPGFPSADTGETVKLYGAPCATTGTVHIRKNEKTIIAFIYRPFCSIQHDCGFVLIKISIIDSEEPTCVFL